MTTSGPITTETPFQHPYRAATPDDADSMAQLVNIAGEDLPLYLWTRLAKPGQSPWDIGRQRAMRDSGSFSYRNTVVREEDGRVVAALMGYPLPDTADPGVYDDLSPMFVPMQQLEDLAVGTWYVNVVAAFPECRGKGYGSELLGIAERLAQRTQRRGLSLVVSDANSGARRLYERLGYTEHAARAMVKESWDNAGEHWLLLLKYF